MYTFFNQFFFGRLKNVVRVNIDRHSHKKDNNSKKGNKSVLSNVLLVGNSLQISIAKSK